MAVGPTVFWYCCGTDDEARGDMTVGEILCSHWMENFGKSARETKTSSCLDLDLSPALGTRVPSLTGNLQFNLFVCGLAWYCEYRKEEHHISFFGEATSQPAVHVDLDRYLVESKKRSSSGEWTVFGLCGTLLARWGGCDKRQQTRIKDAFPSFFQSPILIAIRTRNH